MRLTLIATLSPLLLLGGCVTAASEQHAHAPASVAAEGPAMEHCPMMSGETHAGGASDRSSGMMTMPNGMHHDGMMNCPMAQPASPSVAAPPPQQSTTPAPPADPHQH